MAVRGAALGDTGVNAAIAQVAATDPGIQRRIRKITNALLSDVEWLIKYGTPDQRIALARSVVPVMMKSLASSEGQQDEMKAAYQNMMQELRGDAELGRGVGDG